MDKPIDTWKCHTTHSACDCVLQRLRAAEKVVEACRQKYGWGCRGHDEIDEALDAYDKVIVDTSEAKG